MFFVTSSYSASKTIELKNSRSAQTVELEENYLQFYTDYETRTSNEYGCAPEQVIRTVCRTLFPRIECAPRQWCLLTPYGPVCQTRVICGPTPGGQYCENVQVTENICRTRQVTRSYPVQRSRVLYKTEARVDVLTDDHFPDGEFELSVDLTQDQITYNGTDYGSEYALLMEKIESRSERRGEILEEVKISAVHSLDYLASVAQIPGFISSYGQKLEFSKIQNDYNVPLTIELTLVNRYGQILKREVPQYSIIENEESMIIDYSFMAGIYFYPTRGSLTVKIGNDERLINKSQFFSRQITGSFWL
jgi:hypothetical protein